MSSYEGMVSVHQVVGCKSFSGKMLCALQVFLLPVVVLQHGGLAWLIISVMAAKWLKPVLEAQQKSEQLGERKSLDKNQKNSWQ